MTPETTTPQEEARSLRLDPLPIQLTEADEDLPARIYQMDDQIRITQAELQRLQRTRENLMNRALEINVLEDDFCRIEFKERQTRILDPVKFREQFKEEYDLICEQQRKELIKKAERVGEVIPLGLADKLAGKDAVTAICDIQIERTPYVVRKEP